MLANIAANALLSRAEQILYGRLVRAFPGHIVLSKVALSRLSSAAPADAVADFVVCRADFTAVAVVELDGSTDRRGDARRGDARRDDVRRGDAQLQAAGVGVIRVPAADIPDERALRALVATLSLNGATGRLARPAS